MSHFAKVEDGIVTSVIVAEQDFVDTQEGTWVQTSYNTLGNVHLLDNTPLRKNYAGIGYVYDEGRDAFYSPQPFASWTLNEDTCLWDSPVPYPSEGSEGDAYAWDENNQEWAKLL